MLDKNSTVAALVEKYVSFPIPFSIPQNNHHK